MKFGLLWSLEFKTHIRFTLGIVVKSPQRGTSEDL